MQMHRLMARSLTCAAVALACTFPAPAQNNQSFVSTAGSDANNCTTSAPCRTIAKALTVTNSEGEVVVVNSGNYGTNIKISSPVTISAVGVDASLVTTTGSAVTIDVPHGNVTINGLALHARGAVTAYGVLVQSVSDLRLSNMLIDNFQYNDIEFDAAGRDMTVYNSQVTRSWQHGLMVNAQGARVYVEGSSFDYNAGAGAVSQDGELTINNSSAQFNIMGFAAVGGSVILDNDRVLFNRTGLSVRPPGNLHFANCLISGNTTAAWDVSAGGVLSGSNPGTTFVAPGQTRIGTLSLTTTLE
jgi:hypothetical protein